MAIGISASYQTGALADQIVGSLYSTGVFRDKATADRLDQLPGGVIVIGHWLGAAPGNVGPGRPRRCPGRDGRSEPRRFADAGARRSVHRGVSSHSLTSSLRSPSTALFKASATQQAAERRLMRSPVCRLCWSTESRRRAFVARRYGDTASRSRSSASPSMWRSRSRCFGPWARRAWRWRPPRPSWIKVAGTFALARRRGWTA